MYNDSQKFWGVSSGSALKGYTQNKHNLVFIKTQGLNKNTFCSIFM